MVKNCAAGYSAEAIVLWPSDSASAGQPARIPTIEVAFKNGCWWSIPQAMSQALYERHVQGESDIGYTWDWGDKRKGSWAPDGKETTVNRYVLDFTTMRQENIDKGRLRTFRITWIDTDADEKPSWTGQIPTKPW